MAQKMSEIDCRNGAECRVQKTVPDQVEDTDRSQHFLLSIIVFQEVTKARFRTQFVVINVSYLLFHSNNSFYDTIDHDSFIDDNNIDTTESSSF